ncbi:hypothetical protein GCM10009792_08060 [Microcella alkalica]|uniref:Uncharacterized protein n=1 Tax=Microcella alkalica TaxID=355930 RepID=A0A839E5B9_9MICO|nr:hypothetical protein [Microcella alkalica]MBA8846546.1 hypothetical protein [Microcella alkalica]
MRRPPHRLAATLAAALVGALALGASGCATGTPLDDIVEGLVDQGVEQITSGIDESVRGLVDDVLGGVELSTDGEPPASFPREVPLVGDVLGGGAGPDSTGWVVRTRIDDAGAFAAAAAALEGAGFAASGVSSDTDSGYGAFTSSAYRVDLSVATDAQGEVTATYVVTPA